jgi:hypothetical protein
MILSLRCCLALGLAMLLLLSLIGAAPAPLAINATTMASGNAQLRLSNSTHYTFARDVNALVRRPPHGLPAQRLTDLKPRPTSEECTDKFTLADRANTGRITQGIEYLEVSIKIVS